MKAQRKCDLWNVWNLKLNATVTEQAEQMGALHSWSGAWKRAPRRSPRWAGELTLESQNSQPKIPEGVN